MAELPNDVGRMAQDYLTVVWKAYEWPGGRPTTTDIAGRLRVTPSTVSANLRRLARDGLVDYEPYGAITLTRRGEEIAIEQVRRHRIIETYLADRLGLAWDEVHTEADLLEHAVSDLVLDRMDAELGRPITDPHGDTIPRDIDQVREGNLALLTTIDAGQEVTVIRVDDRSSAVLRYLADKRIGPGVRLQVISGADQTGAVLLCRDGADLELSATAALAVWVRPR